MSLYDLLAGEAAAPALVHGVVIAVVTNTEDPEGMGRVRLRFPWLNDEDESNWARVLAPSAGKGRGVFFMPEVEDEVLVAFEQGDVRFPFVLGGLWGSKEGLPAPNDDGRNNLRVIRSRSGHVIRLNDEDGKESIEIVDAKGKNKLVFDTANGAVTITADKDITLSAPGGKLRLEAQTVEIESSADAEVVAGAGLDVKAAATLNVKGATVNIN